MHHRGLAIAAQLSRNHEITVVAKNLPGDDPTTEWVSPWAGANFVAGYCSAPCDRKRQRDTFSELWRLASRFPESSVKKITMEEFFNGERTGDDLWFREFVPDVCDAEDLRRGAISADLDNSASSQTTSFQKGPMGDTPVCLDMSIFSAPTDRC
ncbi:unnamed protein product [Clonostachys rosea f. rosea IK726]|uniref:Uncharacterized protein n=1 Tax=Clonostachys rosea f. rosea IK726 TaxID=1349383 RepID=A0ACA9TX47_BIOOC|nr:unnamed protein product [Clonostachys rosea f. rosea IK726]